MRGKRGEPANFYMGAESSELSQEGTDHMRDESRPRRAMK